MELILTVDEDVEFGKLAACLAGCGLPAGRVRQAPEESFAAHDPRMLQVLESARQVAAADVPVLLVGENGVGKQTLARWMHAGSPRAKGWFVVANHAPAFAFAQGGTLYVPELATLNEAGQAALLARLEDRAAEVRVVAGTSRDLNSQVTDGRLRGDLFLRLTDCVLAIPPLRERRDDILPLARLLLARAARELHKPVPELAPEAEQALATHVWPGNTSELALVMERAALQAGARVEAADLPMAASAPQTWKQIERIAIEEALRMQNGNRTRAARQLGISLRTLQYRLKEYSMAKGA